MCVLATALALKEDKLTFDSAPTTGSTNPVTSGGVYTALSTKLNKQYAPGTYDAGQLMTVDLNGNIVNTPDTTIKFEEQTLTIAQRKTARDNIEAVSMDELDTKADKVSKIQIGSTGNVTQTIMSNNVYEFTGSLNSLTIVLAVSDESYPVYKFCFNTPATLFSLTLPNNVVFPMDWVLEPSMHYEINIENDYMSFKRWKL